MLNQLVEEDNAPSKFVTADSLYGNSSEFIEALEAHAAKLTYFVETPCDTQCWIKRPFTRKKKYKYGDKIYTKTILEKTAKKPIDVKTPAKSINDVFLVPALCYWKPEEGMNSDLLVFFDETASANLGVDALYSVAVGLTQMFKKTAVRHGYERGTK